MDWTDSIISAVRVYRRKADERDVSPESQRVFRALRGMFELENAHLVEEQRRSERLMSRFSPSDLVVARNLLGFVAWSIHPTHFELAAPYEHFDLRGVGDTALMLKMVAEAETATWYTVKVLLPRMQLVELDAQFEALREFGKADLTILFGAEDRATLNVLPYGNGLIKFVHEVPKVVKADLTHICPKCSKRNKPDAAKCFGCKRLL